MTGAATGFRLDDRVIFAWWGQDAAGLDCIAGDQARLFTFATLEKCRGAAASRGWMPLTDDDSSDEVLDFSAAQEWLRGKRIYLDPVSGLNLWNWAIDAAHSTGTAWDTHGLKAECYDKLVAANVPWLFDMEAHTPRWSPRQILALRAVLERAVRLLRDNFS